RFSSGGGGRGRFFGGGAAGSSSGSETCSPFFGAAGTCSGRRVGGNGAAFCPRSTRTNAVPPGASSCAGGRTTAVDPGASSPRRPAAEGSSSTSISVPPDGSGRLGGEAIQSSKHATAGPPASTPQRTCGLDDLRKCCAIDVVCLPPPLRRRH